jgi:hypothetical protein
VSMISERRRAAADLLASHPPSCPRGIRSAFLLVTSLVMSSEQRSFSPTRFISKSLIRPSSRTMARESWRLGGWNGLTSQIQEACCTSLVVGEEPLVGWRGELHPIGASRASTDLLDIRLLR